MFTFDKIDAQRVLVSSFGALALTAACIGSVAGSVRAATAPASIKSWQQAVERKIDTRGDSFSLAMTGGHKAEAVVAVRFTAEGDYAGAAVARSSGNPALDAHAVKVAGQIAYPPLPDAYRGQPRTVAMRLVFGRADNAEQLAQIEGFQARDTRLARNDAGAGRTGGRIAAK